MKKFIFIILICVFISSCSNVKKENGVDGASSILIKNQKLNVEIADTPEKASQGLMFRDSLPENNGMIFVYSESKIVSFWMKNTKIPLSAAFVSEDGIITEIIDMTPFDETPRVSKNKTKYVIEVNQGWFQKNGIVLGDKVDLSAIKN